MPKAMLTHDQLAVTLPPNCSEELLLGQDDRSKVHLSMRGQGAMQGQNPEPPLCSLPELG